MRFHGHRFSLLAVLVLLLGACTKVPVGPSAGDGLSPEGRPLVPVTLNLSVAGLSSSFAGTSSSFAGLTGESPATKAYNDHEPDVDGLSDPSADRESEIKTILVLQFEQKTGETESHRIGNQQYFDHYPLSLDEHVSLVASESTTANNTIYVIANTFGTIPLDGDLTLSEFKAHQGYNRLSSLDDLAGSGIWYSPNPSAATPDRYLRMSASVELPVIELGTPVGTNANPLELKRNCAKVVVKVKDGSSGAVTIDQVQLRDINRKYYYVTNYASFTDPWSDLEPDRFDEAPQNFSDGVAGTGADAGYTLFTYYVPVNQRGTITNTVESLKNRRAPRGATRFCVYASYTEGLETKHVAYTYYLGANLTNDFNLDPNERYTYTIDIKEKGDPATDARVEHMDDITFTVDANSYMLKPPTGAGQTRTYKIPVRRAAVFWNPVGTNLGVYGASTADALVDDLTESTAWEARVVWNEIYDSADPTTPVPDNQILVGASGTGFNPANPDSTPYITVRVCAGMYGNAVIAIKKTGTEDAATLWSWHVWVTDYDPYVEMTPVADQYIYTVPGGEIHRYASTVWSTARYENAFTMDRFLGALAARGVRDSWGLLYNYGRKDPVHFRNGDSPYKAANSTGSAGGKNIRYGVHHPEMRVDGGGYDTRWTSINDDMANDENIRHVWKDRHYSDHGDDYCEPEKSIYDPCPYGWRVPEKDEYMDFETRAKWEYFTEDGKVQYVEYYPGGYANRQTKGIIYFPNESRTFGSTYFQMADTSTNDVVWWTLRYFPGLNNTNYVYRDLEVSSYAGRESCAVAVRCIRMDYRRPY